MTASHGPPLHVSSCLRQRPLARQRQGSLLISFLFVLFTSVLMVAIFFGVYCFKQVQVNRQGTRWLAAHKKQVQIKDQPKFKWPSPDKQFAFKTASPFVPFGHRKVTLVRDRVGLELFEYEKQGRLQKAVWRDDSRAVALEHRLVAGRSDVVMLVIDGAQCRKLRPGDIIKPEAYLPLRDRDGKRQWEQSIETRGFHDEGDLYVDWRCTATVSNHGRPVRRTTLLYQFRIGITPVGELIITETFPVGPPKTVAL